MQPVSALQWRGLGHPEAVHWYGEHSVVLVEQLPMPEQKAALVYSEPEQDAPPQLTLLGACWQTLPLQMPVLPQGGFRTQPPCGSATLPTLLQTPRWPGTLQAMQVEQLMLPQQ